MRTDVGYMYLMFDERSTGGESLDGYDGRYDTLAHLFGASLTLRF
jgi:long-subunit fatty acid transport protein